MQLFKIRTKVCDFRKSQIYEYHAWFPDPTQLNHINILGFKEENYIFKLKMFDFISNKDIIIGKTDTITGRSGKRYCLSYEETDDTDKYKNILETSIKQGGKLHEIPFYFNISILKDIFLEKMHDVR